MSKKLTRRRAIQFMMGTLAGIGVAGEVANFKRQQVLALDDPTRDFTVVGRSSLKKRAAAKGLIYGTAIRDDHFWQDVKYASNVAQECGIIVPEWALKWYVANQPLRPSPDSFDFSAADRMLGFAKTHGMLFRGHTLVWHQSLPPWFQDTVNRQNAQQFLEKHIKTVVGRYAGKIHSWDVVNEAINIDDGNGNGLRLSPWLSLLGTDYIDYAFRLANAADPQAMLVYNDYGLDYDIYQDEAKRTAVLNLLETLKSKGTPIHALGIQAHLDGAQAAFNPTKLREFLRNVAKLGLKILITELDVTDKELPSELSVRDRIVARAYEDYLSVVLDEPATIAVLTWELSDRYTWLSQFQPRPDHVSVRPLPLDADMKRKLAWNAIARAFDRATKR